MDKSKLSQLQELLAHYPQGEWSLEDGCDVVDDNESYATFCHAIRRFGDSMQLRQRTLSDGQEFADTTAKLIVAAVNALPSLLAERETLRLLLFECARELSYVQCVENCNSGLCATSLGADLVERSIKALEIPDLHEREEEKMRAGGGGR